MPGSLPLDSYSNKVRSGERNFSILTDVRSVTRVPGGTATAELAVLLLESSPEVPDDILLLTTVRVPDGQTVVVGNAVPSASDRTIILVVRPEIGE